MTWLIIFILAILAFAFFIDWRRKKNSNDPLRPINPNSKPGEDSNHTMGDNRYSGGGQ
jgi:LPXTG-motif cell wall-anchored protein